MYFLGYGLVDAQRIILEDKPRTLAYKEAIFKSKSNIKGKIVLDVGSGTGLLSMFCAKAGAKKVHAVEASIMAEHSKAIIAENNLSDVIEVHNCLVENLKLPEKVDVIVSEWMGQYLVKEGMLDSVIVAREKFLKPNGLIIPESADLFVAPCEFPQFFDYWNDVYGFKMVSLGKYDRENTREPIAVEMKEEYLIGEPSVIKSFPLKTINVKDVNEFGIRKRIPRNREDAKYQGLCIWFDCYFRMDNDEMLVLSTHPGKEQTHWKQTVINFPHTVKLEKDELMGFQLNFKRQSDNKREYGMTMEVFTSECVQSVACEPDAGKFLKEQLKGINLSETNRGN